VALRYTGADGQPLRADPGLLTFAASLPGGVPRPVTDHLQHTAAGVAVLRGIASDEQNTGLAPAWSWLAAGLTDLRDQDVLADVGRLWATSPAAPLIQAASLVVVVARSRPDSVFHTRDRLRALSRLTGAPTVVVVVHDQHGATRAVKAVRTVLRRAALPDDVLPLVHDPDGVAGLETGPLTRGLERGLLLRSARALGLELTNRLTSEPGGAILPAITRGGAHGHG
jgi:hypothetical protein